MFDPQLTIGQVLSENEVNAIFHCQPFKGIRMGMNNSVIVIISGSAKKKVYDDIWDGDTLLYNGMDVSSDERGNQTLDSTGSNNNYKLYSTWRDPDSADIFLFVKKESNKCVYKGKVRLKQEPYQVSRHDDAARKVWIFPLELEKIDPQKNGQALQKAEAAAFEMQLEELYNKVKGKAENKQPAGTLKAFETKTIYYERDPDIAAYIKRRANGVCDLCSQKAPFIDNYGHPYLEAHHIIWLSKGGHDEIDNVVALCPNCHRRMHVIDDQNDVRILQQRIARYKENRK